MASRNPPSLFNWLKQADVKELEVQREGLSERIFLLPKKSHKRLELEVLIMQITHRELEIEMEINK